MGVHVAVIDATKKKARSAVVGIAGSCNSTFIIIHLEIDREKAVLFAAAWNASAITKCYKRCKCGTPPPLHKLNLIKNLTSYKIIIYTQMISDYIPIQLQGN